MYIYIYIYTHPTSVYVSVCVCVYARVHAYMCMYVRVLWHLPQRVSIYKLGHTTYYTCKNQVKTTVNSKAHPYIYANHLRMGEFLFKLYVQTRICMHTLM